MNNTNDNNLYVVFFLEGNKYAIDCNYVTAITALHSFKVTPVPDSAPHIKGVINFNNSIINILNLREFFGMQNIDSEYSQLVEYIDSIKQNHINMLNDLEVSINSRKPYKFDIASFNNKFEQIYNKYDTNIKSIRIYSDKIDDLHNQIDKFISKLNNKVNSEEFNPTLDLNYINQNFIQKIFVCMDKIKEEFKHAHKEMLIMVSYNDKQLGVIIDDIYLMDCLNILCAKNEMNKLNNPEYMSGVAKTNNSEDIIMLIDIELLINSQIK